MSDLDDIRAAIGALPLEDQRIISMLANAIRSIVAVGENGMFAMALVGIEIQAEADKAEGKNGNG